MNAEKIAQEISIIMPLIARNILLEFFQSVDIPQSQLITIMTLYEQPSMRLNDLSLKLQISAPTASGLVDRLVKGGYLTRVQDKEDRRAINIELTKKGNALARKFRQAVKKKWQLVLEKIPQKDARQFFEAMLKIEEALKR